MTIFVSEPSARTKGKFNKPHPVDDSCQPTREIVPDSLHYLVETHAECIYFSDDPDQDFGPIVAPEVDIKALLASRITAWSKHIDFARNRRQDCFTPDDFVNVGRTIQESLAVISELERVWEALFGSVPSALEVGQAASS